MQKTAEPKSYSVENEDGRRVIVRFFPNGDIRLELKKSGPMVLKQFWGPASHANVNLLLGKAS